MAGRRSHAPARAGALTAVSGPRSNGRASGRSEPIQEAPAALLEWATQRATGTRVRLTPADGERTIELPQTAPHPPILLPLWAHRGMPAETWTAVAGTRTAVTAVLDLPAELLGGVLPALHRAGVRMIGRVDLAGGERPVGELVDEVARWGERAVDGLLLDNAPIGPEELGAVALAVRAARRRGLGEVLLAFDRPPHPRYRCLEVGVIGFVGGWLEYQRTPAEQLRPGDGHLVFEVPAAQLCAARRLIGLRRAGWALATPVAAPR